MKRFSFFPLGLLTLLAGCTMVILPSHTRQSSDQTSLVYLAINQPPVPPPAVVKPTVSTHSECAELKLPVRWTIPEVPRISAADRLNRQLVEDQLVDYILLLRRYITHTFESYDAFYKEYQRACRAPK